jgi:hypothetical protein
MNKSMIIYTSGWGSESGTHNTFKMLPASNDCPFNEVLFDPSSKVLAVVGKEKKQAYRFVPKIDDKGKPIMTKDRNGNMTEVQERKLMENFYEYYIETKEDVINFVNSFAINSTNFDWMKYVDPLPNSKL